MKRTLAAVLLATACTAPDATRRTLEAEGYEDIKTLGYTPFQCGNDDKFSTGFEATNAKGDRVRGTVCCGFLKGCTVRH